MMAAPISAAIIAGGTSSRMQEGGIAGDKFLQLLGERAMLDHVIDRLSRQIAKIRINANGDPARFAHYDLPVLPDDALAMGGPLAGIASALRAGNEDEFLLTIAADTPFFPHDLVEKFAQTAAETGSRIVMARSNGRLHPIFALWHTSLNAPLRHWLTLPGKASIMRFAEHIGFEVVDFDNFYLPQLDFALDPFFNINEPQDLLQAQQILKALP